MSTNPGPPSPLRPFLATLDQRIAAANAKNSDPDLPMIEADKTLEALELRCKKEGEGARGVSKMAALFEALAGMGGALPEELADEAKTMAVVLDSVEHIASEWEKTRADVAGIRARLHGMKRRDSAEQIEIMTQLRNYFAKLLEESERRGFH